MGAIEVPGHCVSASLVWQDLPQPERLTDLASQGDRLHCARSRVQEHWGDGVIINRQTKTTAEHSVAG
jgi:hypothetical protein